MGQMCQIRIIDTFEVIVDGRTVSVDSWRSRRAADVVKLLALEPEHRLHREQVMESLWPDLEVDAAAANLRKAMHYARRALGSDQAIHAEGGLLMLWPDAEVEVDLEVFDREAQEALASGDRESCRHLAMTYAGEVLPADRYEPWTEEARRRTQARRVLLLKSAEEWESVLDLDETDEEAHRSLMRTHLDAGNRREAIRQFERLRDVLREHIGVGPDAETVALYERVLELEGPEVRDPAEHAAVLVANGLVAWSRRDLDEAERLASEARSLALTVQSGHELGEASTLLGLIAFARGTWHDRFREEFAESVKQTADLEMAVYDGHLCFQEFYLYGPEGHKGAAVFAEDLLDTATAAGSVAGKALAVLLLGEFELLSGEVDRAAGLLEKSARYAATAGCISTESIALERLAEAEVARRNQQRARKLLDSARSLAKASGIPSHLLVRVFGVQLTAADRPLDALQVAQEAERVLSDVQRVCEPCSMNFHVQAARVFARGGHLQRARRHLAEAERITGLWQGGPWIASVWEARAEVRLAEGEDAQATALFREAAHIFADLRRPIDEARCREAAMAIPIT